MSTYLTPNETAVAGTNCDGLEFFSTTARPQRRSAINDFLYHGGARVNER